MAFAALVLAALSVVLASGCGDPETSDDRGYTKAPMENPAPIIDGDPSIPVLTIHTIGDLFVPIEMERPRPPREALRDREMMDVIERSAFGARQNDGMTAIEQVKLFHVLEIRDGLIGQPLGVLDGIFDGVVLLDARH